MNAAQTGQVERRQFCRAAGGPECCGNHRHISPLLQQCGRIGIGFDKDDPARGRCNERLKRFAPGRADDDQAGRYLFRFGRRVGRDNLRHILSFSQMDSCRRAAEIFSALLLQRFLIGSHKLMHIKGRTQCGLAVMPVKNHGQSVRPVGLGGPVSGLYRRACKVRLSRRYFGTLCVKAEDADSHMGRGRPAEFGILPHRASTWTTPSRVLNVSPCFSIGRKSFSHTAQQRKAFSPGRKC